MISRSAVHAAFHQHFRRRALTGLILTAVVLLAVNMLYRSGFAGLVASAQVSSEAQRLDYVSTYLSEYLATGNRLRSGPLSEARITQIGDVLAAPLGSSDTKEAADAHAKAKQIIGITSDDMPYLLVARDGDFALVSGRDFTPDSVKRFDSLPSSIRRAVFHGWPIDGPSRRLVSWNGGQVYVTASSTPAPTVMIASHPWWWVPGMLSALVLAYFALDLIFGRYIDRFYDNEKRSMMVRGIALITGLICAVAATLLSRQGDFFGYVIASILVFYSFLLYGIPPRQRTADAQRSASSESKGAAKENAADPL